MNGDSRFPSLSVAIGSGIATVLSAAASVAIPEAPSLEWLAALMAGGFLYFVRKWMSDREKADHELMAIIREHIAQQKLFEIEVQHFMGLLKGKLNIHNSDSDPNLHVAKPEAPAR